MNCILALKSYHEWKQSGGNGAWKYSANSRPNAGGKHSRRNSDLFLSFLSKNSSSGEKSPVSAMSDDDEVVRVLFRLYNFLSLLINLCIRSHFSQFCKVQCTSPSLQKLIRELLSDKNAEEIPMVSDL